MKNKVIAVITCAGKGERAGLGMNKLLTFLPNGKRVIQTTIETFDKCPKIEGIVITANADDFSIVQDIASKLNTPTRVILGGESRSQSVFNGVVCAEGDIVLIHDGARPFVTQELIERCIESVIEQGSAVAVCKPLDTVAQIDEKGLIVNASKQDKRIVQTPQAFYKDKLLFAFNCAKENENFPDESSLYSKYVAPVFTVESDISNKKLTYANDFCFNNDLKVGVGFDLHTLVENRKLILGGVEIEHGKGLLGHSDADVLTHAIMDSMLSALSLRDIGYHFSDKDPAYKDISSMVLLERVVNMIFERGYKINNLSAVIMAEKPKLSPYVDEITLNIAKILNILPQNVGITCTTTEKIGLVGREEGIAVSAFCSVVKTN